MSKKIIVAYTSKYGTTQQYAQWSAKALGAECAEAKGIKPESFADYDVVVYGGGLYAGGIAGIKRVTQAACKNLVVFTVGLADPSATDYSDIVGRSFTAQLLAKTKIFHLRGGVDYTKLGRLDRFAMSMVKRMVEKMPEDERKADDRALLETYGKAVDFMDEQSIGAMVDYVKSLA